MDEPGFSIGDEFYAFPTSFRLGDPVLVGEVTGLGWNEFAEMLDQGDPRTLAGLVAVAVWQKHPQWRRERVLLFVESLAMESLVFNDVESEDDAVPPLQGAGITTESPASSTLSSDELVLSDADPNPTGLLLSETLSA
jgi:hypothetical protein